MVAAFALDEAIREARGRTGVPGVAAGLRRGESVELAADGVLELGRDERVTIETPFRIASVSKSFTAALALDAVPEDPALRRLLSHTAGLRPEAASPLPAEASGLFSYSNAGYWLAGARAAAALGVTFEEAMRTRLLEPLELRATGYEEPSAPARGHVQEGETGHRAVPVDSYAVERRPSGGLWSTVDDLLSWGAAQLERRDNPAFEPQVEALGARYALGWWVREGIGRRTVLDHEGSVAGYQSLLLLVPEEPLVLAVLTNSWRGSGLIRHIVEHLGVLPSSSPSLGRDGEDVAGRYALDATEALVERSPDGFAVTETEIDPVTAARRSVRYPVSALGGGAYGFARGTLMSHRVDFPRAGVARVGWVALPRAGA